MSNLLVVIPGFGPKNIELKRLLFDKNINIIKKTFSGNVSVIYFNYSDEKEDLQSDNVNIIQIMEKGVVGQFIFRNITPSFVSDNKYDYIIILLDDIELPSNYNISYVIELYKKYNFNILSPILSHDSKYMHDHMLEKNNSNFNKTIIVSDFVECFAYFMDVESYKKYYSCLTDKTTWLWGVDYVLTKYYGLKCGIIHDYKMKHYIMAESYTKDLPSPWTELEYNLSKINNDTSKNILEIIHI
jgi:hypothetical protein